MKKLEESLPQGDTAVKIYFENMPGPTHQVLPSLPPAVGDLIAFVLIGIFVYLFPIVISDGVEINAGIKMPDIAFIVYGLPNHPALGHDGVKPFGQIDAHIQLGIGD